MSSETAAKLAKTTGMIIFHQSPSQLGKINLTFPNGQNCLLKDLINMVLVVSTIKTKHTGEASKMNIINDLLSGLTPPDLGANQQKDIFSSMSSAPNSPGTS